MIRQILMYLVLAAHLALLVLCWFVPPWFDWEWVLLCCATPQALMLAMWLVLGRANILVRLLVNAVALCYWAQFIAHDFFTDEIVAYLSLLLARISHHAVGKAFFSSGRTGRPRGDRRGGREPAAEAGWSAISRAFLHLGAGNLAATPAMSVAKQWRNASARFRREPTERAGPPDPTAIAIGSDWRTPGRRSFDTGSSPPARTTPAAR